MNSTQKEETLRKIIEIEHMLSDIQDMDAVIVAVSHKQFLGLDKATISGFFSRKNDKKVLVDIKGIFDRKEYTTEDYIYWRL